MSTGLLLLSGGIDSSTLLHYLIKKKKIENLYVLSFNYGQKHIKELEKAQWQTKQFPNEVKKHFVADLSFIKNIIQQKSCLVGNNINVPALKEIKKEDLQQPITYVPHRNMFLLSVACSYAESLNCFEVYYGAQKQDHYSYWDCSPQFLNSMNKTLAFNHKNPIKIYAPFINKSKLEIVKLALKLNVNLEQTWTCYRGQDNPCLECPACIERTTAFKKL